MNGQQRSNYNTDFSKINIVKSVLKITDYRDYKMVLYVRPFYDTHLGYLDETFFGIKIPDQKSVFEPTEALDYYLDKIPQVFRNSSIEYSTFASKDTYKPFVNALNLVRSRIKNKNGNKTTA